jgi:hypothetical protein
VVDDCRYPNEYWRLKELGFVTIRVTSPEAKRVERLQRIGRLDNITQLKHETEVALDDYSADYTIPNPEDDPEALHSLVASVLAKAERKVYG